MFSLKRMYQVVKKHVDSLELESIVTETTPLIKGLASKAKDAADEVKSVVSEIISGDYAGLLVLDYDGTMMAHNYPDWYQGNTDYYTDAYTMLTKGDEMFVDDKPIPAVQWYARAAHDNGYKVICLTHEIFNLRDDIKQRNIALHYGGMGMEYYTVDSAAHKIPFIKAYADAIGIPHKNITLVEDNMSTVNLAVGNGIHAVHISSVVADYENRGVKETK